MTPSLAPCWRGDEATSNPSSGPTCVGSKPLWCVPSNTQTRDGSRTDCPLSGSDAWADQSAINHRFTVGIFLSVVAVRSFKKIKKKKNHVLCRSWCFGLTWSSQVKVFGYSEIPLLQTLTGGSNIWQVKRLCPAELFQLCECKRLLRVSSQNLQQKTQEVLWQACVPPASPLILTDYTCLGFLSVAMDASSSWWNARRHGGTICSPLWDLTDGALEIFVLFQIDSDEKPDWSVHVHFISPLIH